MNPATDAPDRLRLARRRAGLTQEKLARLLGTSPSHVSRMETRKVPVDPDLLCLTLALADMRPEDAAAVQRLPPHPPYGRPSWADRVLGYPTDDRGWDTYADAGPGNGHPVAAPRRRRPGRLLRLREEAAVRWGVDPRSVCPGSRPDRA